MDYFQTLLVGNNLQTFARVALVACYQRRRMQVSVIVADDEAVADSEPALGMFDPENNFACNC